MPMEDIIQIADRWATVLEHGTYAVEYWRYRTGKVLHVGITFANPADRKSMATLGEDPVTCGIAALRANAEPPLSASPGDAPLCESCSRLLDEADSAIQRTVDDAAFWTLLKHGLDDIVKLLRVADPASAIRVEKVMGERRPNPGHVMLIG